MQADKRNANEELKNC